MVCRWIELLNIGTGVVQGSLSHTVVQVFDRIVLAGALFMLPGLRTSASVPIIFLSWAIADLLRHVFYGVTLLYFVIDMCVFTAISWPLPAADRTDNRVGRV
jgi:hypothetical protein|eukprot:COSAG01_NODE_20017_length_975_cov_35.530822_1_plen_102_part_10